MRGPDTLLDALRRRGPHILVLAGLLTAMDALRAFPILFDLGWRSGSVITSVAVQTLATCTLLVAAITYAERTAFAQRHRAIALGLAVGFAAPIATAIGALLSITIDRTLDSLGVTATFGTSDGMSLYLYLLWYSIVVGLLAATYFTMWERAQRSATQLRQAEIERQGVKQRVVESRLNVMKARVDPEFLFRMIRDVQRLYRRDVDGAEQRLDDLIDYLRAALPQMRSGATTLGEEMHLAAAYVRLHEEAFQGRLEFAFDVDESLEAAQFPPMALLPLVDDALRRALESPQPRLALTISAALREDGLTVSVGDDCAQVRDSSGGEPGLVEHERAFTQFFGEGARIRRTSTRSSETRVLLEIDHAIATRTDR